MTNLDNFYVGEQGWLVHNCDWRVLANIRSSYGRYFGAPASTAGYADPISHILGGNIRSSSGFKYTGGHLQSSLPNGASVTNIISRSDGVYQGTITFVDSTGKIYTKADNTFFPQSWSSEQTISEIVSVLNTPGNVSGNRFTGLSTSGIAIEGFLDSAGRIISANPVW